VAAVLSLERYSAGPAFSVFHVQVCPKFALSKEFVAVAEPRVDMAVLAVAAAG
jgi:hypothetical protein